MNELRSLDTRQQCREKLPIWFGSRSNHYHGLLEVMMNGNDEMVTHPDQNRPFKLEVEINDDSEAVVRDYGRGIRLTDMHDGIPVYQILLETLFAGTNFDNMKSGKETTGTNGCGLTVLNHTSEAFHMESHVGYDRYLVSYFDGGQDRTVQSWKDKSEDYGTCVRFVLDPEIYTQIFYNEEEVKSMCNHLAGISNGLEIDLVFDKEKYNYKYDSLLDYAKSNFPEDAKIVEFEERTASEKVDNQGEYIDENNRMKLLWSIGTEPFQETFLNYTYLKEGGSIYEGVIEGFRKILDKYSDAKTKITASDVELGLNFVCGVWSNNVEFANQTKFSTKKASYKKHVTQYVVDNLEAFRLEHEKEFEDVLKHFVVINDFNKKTENEIKTLKNKIQKGKKGLSPKIEGLIDCDMKKSNPEDRILIIDEGLSANATIINSRDPLYMGCIGLRGRFINSYKTTAQKVFANEPAMAIIAALGCGIELPEKERKKYKDLFNFNKDELRYGKIAIITDADSFGKAITLSLLCFFHKFYPTLCEEGRIYVVSSPRFVIYDNKSNAHYAYDESEKQEIVKKLSKNLHHIGIVKGLGELNKEEFWEYVLSPEAREHTFTQVDFSGDEKEIEQMFEITMGEKIEERKEFIIDEVVRKNRSEQN